MIYLFQILNGIGLGMLYFLLAVGLSVIFGLLQFVNFAHGAFYLLGAYLTFDLTQRGFSFWAAMPMATLIVAGIAAAIEALLLHRIYKLPHTFHILVTVGLALVIQELVIIAWGPLGGSVPAPEGVAVVAVETAQQMRAAVEAALPADAAVMAAAVADWRVVNASERKIKKDAAGLPPALKMTQNPDILAWISRDAQPRPALVVGFAAETDDLVANAMAKRARKGCDWIVANDVRPATGIMGGTENAVILVTDRGAEHWPRLPKDEVARRLAARIARALEGR